MISCLHEINSGLGDTIDQSMFLSDSAGPASCQHILEGFRFSDSSQRISEYGFNQFENSQRGLAVDLHPMAQILPKLGMEHGFAFNAPCQGPSPAGVSLTVPACLSCPPRDSAQRTAGARSWESEGDAPSQATPPVHRQAPWQPCGRRGGAR